MRDQKTHLILNNFKWYVGLTSPFQSHWWWWWWCHWWLSQGNVWQATTQEFGPNLILGILASRPVRGLGAQVPAAIIISMKIRYSVKFWTNIMSDYGKGSSNDWVLVWIDWTLDSEGGGHQAGVPYPLGSALWGPLKCASMFDGHPYKVVKTAMFLDRLGVSHARPRLRKWWFLVSHMACWGSGGNLPEKCSFCNRHTTRWHFI